MHIILIDLKEKQGLLISSLHILFSPLIAKREGHLSARGVLGLGKN